MLPFVQLAVTEADSIAGFRALYSMAIRVCPSSYSEIHGLSSIWIPGWGSDQAECPTSSVTDGRARVWSCADESSDNNR